MAYKLAIANKVGVKVKGTYIDENGKEKSFEFVLECDRLSSDEMRDVATSRDNTAFDFFRAHATGWRGQTLVQDDDGKPAEFCAAALDALLSIGGMAVLCWHSYAQQVGAIAKN